MCHLVLAKVDSLCRNCLRFHGSAREVNVEVVVAAQDEVDRVDDGTEEEVTGLGLNAGRDCKWFFFGFLANLSGKQSISTNKRLGIICVICGDGCSGAIWSPSTYDFLEKAALDICYVACKLPGGKHCRCGRKAMMKG